MAESIVVVGSHAVGAAATAIYAHAHREAIVIPPGAWAGGLAATLLIGAAAGLATVSFRTESGVAEDESWTVVDSAVRP